MLQILGNWTREIAPSSRHYSEPRLDGDVYAVVKRHGRFEVRCWTFRHGKAMTDELVDSFEFESAADCVARVLAEGENNGGD